MAAHQRHRILIIRVVFYGAVLFAMVVASLPQPPQIPAQPSDRAQHIIAFAVLTLLARFAYSAVQHWRLFVSLAAFGACIELVQAIPALQRDASALDWLVDCAAIFLTLLGIAIVRKTVST